MKTILAFVAFTILGVFVSGCTSRVGASVSHRGEGHGITAKGSTEDGVSGRVRAY